MEREGPPKVTILVDRRVVYAMRAIRWGGRIADARRFGRDVKSKVERVADFGRDMKLWASLLLREPKDG